MVCKKKRKTNQLRRDFDIYSVLHRNKDNAISLEHFYFGRFNMGRFN